VAIYTSAKALSRWPINDESTLTMIHHQIVQRALPAFFCFLRLSVNFRPSFQETAIVEVEPRRLA
jgi:hypothetical protein